MLLALDPIINMYGNQPVANTRCFFFFSLQFKLGVFNCNIKQFYH